MSAIKNNDDKKNITLDLNISNFGPHKAVCFKEDLSSINICVYADNGRGKTIISTLFDLLKDEPACLNREAKELVSFGQNKGSFAFSIRNNKDSKEEKFSFDIDRNSGLNNKRVGKYVFHVFNDGFVEKNLREHKYKTDLLNKKGTIATLGAKNIDLKEKESKLADLQNNYLELKNNLQKAISEIKDGLKKLKVSPNFDVFKNIKYDSIFTPVNANIESFETAENNFAAISAMPDDQEDIRTLNSAPFNYNEDLFKSVFDILGKEFTRSNISETVKSKIKANRYFYESGINLYKSGGPCPFCEQNLNITAQKIIEEYETFFKDEEGKITNTIKENIQAIADFNNLITQTKLRYSEISASFNALKVYIPKFSGDTVENMLNFNDLENYFSKLIAALNDKNNDIEKAISIDFGAENIKKTLEAITLAIGAINDKVALINAEKNAKTASIKLAKQKLCVSAWNDFKRNKAQDISQIQQLEKEIETLKNDIQANKNAGSIEKKAKIYEIFQKLMEKVFVNKYSFDPKTGDIRFKDKVLKDNVHSVFSEGERRILAFCYYLALTYDYVKSEADMDKIIFVIDDPVSSLDFNYVYAVAQLINEIPSTFNIKYKKCIILTHHLEFLNILIANNIVPTFYLLDAEGGIKSVNARSLNSYFSHLKDIVEFAALSNILSFEHPHTISNSLRNVLETISKFKYDTTNIDTFIKNEKDSVLSKNAHLVKMCHDLSHGGFRSGIVIPNDTLKSCCNTVIEYLRQNFPGQLNAFPCKVTPIK